MPKLRNIKNELFCREIIKHKGNAKQSYLAVYPNVKEVSAEVSSTRLLSKDKIVNRIYELLQADKNTNDEAVRQGLAESMSATRPLIHKNKLKFIPDNQVRLETQKFLAKGYGFNPDNAVKQDNRSINITINEADKARIEAITQNLLDLNKTLELNTIQDGEIC